MELEFLGTGAGVPAKHRNVSSLALKLLDERNSIWLFDCGEGTQMQILRTNIKPRKIEKIFITHLHGDHIFGLDIPAGPVYGKLKQGQIVTLKDGRVINGKDFVGENKKGRIVTIFGDTRFTTKSSTFAKDSDVIVHESTFNKNEAKLAKAYFHSTTQQAATIAKEAQAKQLYLTHISARYLAKEAKELELEAQEVFADTTVVKDFDTFEVPFP